MARKRADLEAMTSEELTAAEHATDARVEEARRQPADPELERRVKEVVARGYPMRVWREPEGYFAADAPDLDGCLGTGDSPAGAMEDLREAMAAWVEARLVDGLPIPQPGPTESGSYSGRLLLRMPKSLHRDLARAAEREGTSINQVVVALIAAGVGRGDVGLAADAVRGLDTTGLDPGTPDYEVRRCFREMLRVIASGDRWEGRRARGLARSADRLVGD